MLYIYSRVACSCVSLVVALTFRKLHIYNCVRSFACYRVEVSPFGQYPEEVLPEGECENGTPNT